MKKTLQVALWTILLFTLSFVYMDSNEAAAKEFTDVPKNHPNYKAIQDMQKNGFIGGYPDGTFRPNERISRKHVAQLLDKALKLPQPTATKALYMDVPKNHPYYTPIMKLSKAGIVGGTNGKFNPDAPITRIQMAKVLDLAFDFNMTTHNAFDDVYSNHWGYTHANALFASGVAKGDNGKFYPNAPVTRAHYAEFLHRAIEANKSQANTGKVTKNKAWDLSNRLTHSIESVLIEGKSKNQSFSAIRPKLLTYATKEFTDGVLKDYYPYACTECDSFLFPYKLQTEPLVRFQYTQPTPDSIDVQTVEFADGLAHGGFIDYKFKKEAGNWKMSGYSYKPVGTKNFQLTVDEAKTILKEDYGRQGARYVNVTYVSKTQDISEDPVSKKPYLHDRYIFTVETDKERVQVEFHSDSGMYY
ncbi:S-layer homology domain-containing protein [Sporosarcina obsidiansis]|uniref:S-layer homology domain-containing protein n=1 Tax=Sporosarcina obsidiansis TaxID=2660748 RepID=UPI00129BC274|nr:S-layer homology domain-containing protein [Sporosarcina obsidiansis]